MEKPLVARLVAIRLAENLGGVNLKFCVPSPRTVPNIALYFVPSPPVVPRIMSHCVTILAHSRAPIIASPDQIIRLGMEMKNLRPESIRNRRCFGTNPGSSCVRCIVECFGVCDQIRAIAGVRVMIECQEMLIREELIPGVALVAGLPYGVVGQSYQDGLSEAISETGSIMLLHELTVESWK